MPSKSFPKDSRDLVESLWADVVLKGYPAYKDFWEKFVGTHEDREKRILPMMPKFPEFYDEKARRRFERRHEQICMLHYSVFLDFAGAYFQLQNARNSFQEQEPGERYFALWEAVETFYQHLQNACYRIERLWRTAAKLCGFQIDMRKYLDGKSQRELLARLDEQEERVSVRRGDIVHFARGAHIPFRGSFLVTITPKRGQLWSEALQPDEPYQEVTVMMEEDLRLTEEAVNGLEVLLIDELDECFKREGIVFT